jgi:L-asparaginase/Glu-tRNA(Gln) amidotransferase subunit D
MVYLHRVVLDVPDDVWVDHRNGDRLDNRSDNLRPADQTQNLGNALGLWVTNSSGYRGVCYSQRRRRWRATIRVHNHQRELGAFGTPQEAALAYDLAARVNFGEFARCNYPDES